MASLHAQNMAVRGILILSEIEELSRTISVDTLGLVIGVIVRAANSADAVEGCNLMERCRDRWTRLQKVLADGAYQGRFIRWVEQHLPSAGKIQRKVLI